MDTRKTPAVAGPMLAWLAASIALVEGAAFMSGIALAVAMGGAGAEVALVGPRATAAATALAGAAEAAVALL